jgi:heterodisulfide reductase subunit B2
MSKRFAIFLGCNIPARLKQYETSSRAVLSQLDVDLVDIPDFNCCGYPLRNINRNAFLLSSARNMALAEQQNLDLLTLCQCGYGTFRMAEYLMARDAVLKEEINNILSKEGLRYEGKIEIRHLLSLFYHDIGLDAIKEKIEKPYENLQVAVHYGCHALRPSNVVRFDDPVAPTLFDRLVEITGAESIAWPTKLDCCGGPLSGIHDSLSLDFAEIKMEDARKAGAHCIATACPYCQIQFDTIPKRMVFERGEDHRIPAILYPQLLGLSMGIDADILGVDSIRSRIAGFRRRLAA